MHRRTKFAAITAAFISLSIASNVSAQTMPLASAAPMHTTTQTAKTLTVTPSSSSPDHDARAPHTEALRLTSPIQVDGKLDEAVWQTTPTVSELHQVQPTEGADATLRTEVHVFYDNEFIYVGARMYDDHAATIAKRLARRDNETGGDFIGIQFDPYHNHNGDASFWVAPSGSRMDGGNGDMSWDPVYEVKAHVDSLGWTAEMKIPFSQLRFKPGSTGPWGFQVERFINRLNEDDVWSYWPRNEQGGPSRWGHITGISNPAKLPGRLEVLPYVVSQAELHSDVDAANPFAKSSSATMRAGADFKYQVTSTLTLSATLNPDFGQAEVDPAVVNLSAFETFFDEKREFFIEGRDKFRFGSLWCFTCSNTSSLSMLFTRRIGRPPQGAGLAYSAGEYADVPGSTTILGAAKLTGRTSKGWNIGVLDATTARENADVRSGANLLKQEVEPATNYFVSRVSRDLKNGDLQVGGILTSVYRDFNDAQLADMLNKHSEGAGADMEYWWKNRQYHLLAQGALTNISGDPDAVLRAQRSSARYFQRPDRENGSNGLFSDAYDPTMTSMRGYGSYLRLAKEGGDFRWESSLNVRSPGFENNDIAALSRADYVWMHGNLNRRWTKPGSFYRNANLTIGGQQQFNYDGDLTARQAHLSAYIQLPNYWEMSFWGSLKPQVMDDRLTRGGPVVADPREHDFELNFNTDTRKALWLSINHSNYSDVEGGKYRGISTSVTWQPASNISLNFGPNYTFDHDPAQYIRAVVDATAQNFYGTRYIFSDIDSKTLSMDTRVNVTFTPTMSLQLFAQPFISSNSFSQWKQFAQPRDVAKQVFGRDVGTVSETNSAAGRNITIDPDGAGPASSFSISDPNFTFRSLRGNAVFRWEYTPGSTLYLVWTQDRSSSDPTGDFELERDRRALLSSPANHVFLIKVNYWLPL